MCFSEEPVCTSTFRLVYRGRRQQTPSQRASSSRWRQLSSPKMKSMTAFTPLRCMTKYPNQRLKGSFCIIKSNTLLSRQCLWRLLQGTAPLCSTHGPRHVKWMFHRGLTDRSVGLTNLTRHPAPNYPLGRPRPSACHLGSPFLCTIFSSEWCAASICEHNLNRIFWQFSANRIRQTAELLSLMKQYLHNCA